MHLSMWPCLGLYKNELLIRPTYFLEMTIYNQHTFIKHHCVWCPVLGLAGSAWEWSLGFLSPPQSPDGRCFLGFARFCQIFFHGILTNLYSHKQYENSCFFTSSSTFGIFTIFSFSFLLDEGVFRFYSGYFHILHFFSLLSVKWHLFCKNRISF